MPEIRLEHITKRWGKFYGVDDLNLVIENNAFVTLLGPSGCGKTQQETGNDRGFLDGDDDAGHAADDRGTGDPH